MDFMLLGVLEVRGDDGAPLRIPSGRLRTLLAALLVDRGRVVSADTLSKYVWDDIAPAHTRSALEVMVARLRKSLGPVGAARIRTASPGYWIDIDSAEFDVERFENLRRRGGEAAARGDWPATQALLAQALKIWRGSEAFPDIPSQRLRDEHTQRLAELRLQALRQRIDADLGLGRHDAVVAELDALTRAHPLNEHFTEQLMTALYRSGRQAEALEAFHALRQALRSEVGIEPGPPVRTTFQRILEADPILAAPGRAALTVASLSALRPSELPADPADFTGRDRETELIRRRLIGSRPATGVATGIDGPGPVALAAISGPGGIGKTALAVHVAHRVAREFPDGQLFANLRGAGPAPATAADILAGFLRSLGVPADDVPGDGTGRASLFRSLTAGRRLLVVLDDTASAAQVRPLLPGSGSCAVLLTSRLRLPDLEGCQHLDLDVLPADEAAGLLIRIAGRSDADPEPEAIQDLVAACGRLPLALRIAGARLATRRAWTVGDLVDLLRVERHRLDELVAGDLQVRATFDVSYRSLPATQARTFRMLSIGGLEDIAVNTAAALLDLPDTTARRLAEALVDASLLMPSSAGRYRYHDLIKLFAQEAAEETDPGAERDAALARLLAVYRQKLEVAVGLIRNGRSSSDPGQEVFADAQQARRWLESESGNIVNAVVHALRRPDLPPDEPLAIIRHSQWHLRSSGSWDSSRRMSQAALDRAVADADSAAELAARQYLGLVAVLTGEPGEAEAQLTRALDLARTIGDRSAQAAALNRLGLLHFTRDEMGEAVERHQAALEIFRELDDRSGMCTTMINLGKSLSEAGRAAQALPLIEESLAMASSAGDQVNVAFAEYNLARCYRCLSRHDEAIAVHMNSLPKLREAGLREGEAHTLADLGETLLDAGRQQEALTHLLDATALLRTLGDRHSAATYAITAGRAHRALGSEAEAVRLWSTALETLTITSPSYADEIRRLIDESPVSGEGEAAGCPEPKRGRWV